MQVPDLAHFGMGGEREARPGPQRPGANAGSSAASDAGWSAAQVLVTLDDDAVRPGHWHQRAAEEAVGPGARRLDLRLQAVGVELVAR